MAGQQHISTTDYYVKGAIYPSIVTVLSTLIYSLYDNYGYKSEWLTSDFVTITIVLYALASAVILGILCLSIYFVKIKQIKNNWLFTFLSWFALPLAYMLIVLLNELLFSVKSNDLSFDSLIYDLLLIVPFLMGLIYSYVSYRRRIASSEKKLN